MLTSLTDIDNFENLESVLFSKCMEDYFRHLEKKNLALVNINHNYEIKSHNYNIAEKLKL